jgi:hypothetical protein
MAGQPHTDPYDVLVVQVSGEKDWTICTPFPKTGGGRTASLNPAQRAQLRELERDNIQGCTSYVPKDLEAMECENVTLRAGDTLYMPKGTVHMARTQAQTASTHLTIGLFRKGHTWLDLFARQCHLTTDSQNCEQLTRAVVTVSHTPEGLAWLDLAAPPLTLATAEDRLQALLERFRVRVAGETPEALPSLYKRLQGTADTTGAVSRKAKSHIPSLPPPSPRPHSRAPKSDPGFTTPTRCVCVCVFWISARRWATASRNGRRCSSWRSWRSRAKPTSRCCWWTARPRRT